MRRAIVREPSQEMLGKIRRARAAISTQTPRAKQCPYCLRNSIIVFDDTRGHVQAKCKFCGHETVFDVLSMRLIPRS